MKVSSPWFMPFAYVIIAQYTYSLCESLLCGVTARAWWNLQRMTLLRRTGAYLFSVINAIFGVLGISEPVFVVTAKGGDDDGMAKRYEQEIMEFGSDSPMFTWLATLALINLVSLAGALIRVVMGKENSNTELLILQFILCGSLVALNLPIYEALFFRKDEGKLPMSVTLKSLALALVLCSAFIA